MTLLKFLLVFFQCWWLQLFMYKENKTLETSSLIKNKQDSESRTLVSHDSLILIISSYLYIIMQYWGHTTRASWNVPNIALF